LALHHCLNQFVDFHVFFDVEFAHFFFQGGLINLNLFWFRLRNNDWLWRFFFFLLGLRRICWFWFFLFDFGWFIFFVFPLFFFDQSLILSLYFFPLPFSLGCRLFSLNPLPTFFLLL
jgi:hypothetical protein